MWFCNAYSMGRWNYDTRPDPEQDWGRLGTLTHSLPHWAIQRPHAIPLPQQQQAAPAPGVVPVGEGSSDRLTVELVAQDARTWLRTWF